MRDMTSMNVQIDDPRDAAVRVLLQEHLDGVATHSPPESIHALDAASLCAPEMTFWTVRASDLVIGCGALLELDPTHGEIKSMRTTRTHLRRGVATAILTHIIAEAQRRSYQRLSLETGAQDAFEPARAFYRRFGFEPCGPFGQYRPDPNSVFMSRTLV